MIPEMQRPARDVHGRLLPGSVPGWGMSWWWHEQGLDPADTSALSREEIMRHVFRYWDAVNAGWSPTIAQEHWVGTHHPWKSSDD
jgi:hypothetical protein